MRGKRGRSKSRRPKSLRCAPKVMQSVHLPAMVSLQPTTSTGDTQEDKESDKLFTLSLENQMQHQSPLRAAKESTACTSATVKTRWVLATNVSTPTSKRKEKDTPSVTCVSSERKLLIYITRYKDCEWANFSKHYAIIHCILIKLCIFYIM